MFTPWLIAFMSAWKEDAEQATKTGKPRFDYYIAKTLRIATVIIGIILAIQFFGKLHHSHNTESTGTQQPHRTPPTDPAKKYWIHNKTRKTHNYTCQYYLNCDGRYSSTGSGDNCLICGGEIEEE